MLESGKWFLALSVLLRFTAGIGSAMFTVSATSILLKGTDYSSTTIVVSAKMYLNRLNNFELAKFSYPAKAMKRD